MKNLYSVPPLTQFAISDRFIDDSYRNRSGRLKKINDYLLVRKAGNGSTSKVFEALDEKSGMTYAAKAIHIESHSSNAMNLEREIRNLRRLQNNFKSYSNCPATDKKLHNLHPTPPHNNTSSIGKTHGSINSSLSAPMMTFMNCDMKNDDNDFDTTVSNFNSTFDDHQLNIDTQQIDDDYNLVKMLEVLHCKKTHTVYLILEYAKNGSLQDLINKNVELDEDTIVTIFKNILNGVRYLHSQGIVHHDIKPSNILIFENKAKLADFGIGHSFYSAENVIGSPAFQAPEFFDDSEELIDPEEEDVWSLGVTLYYSVFGKLPYVGDSVYEIVKKIKETKLEFPKEKAISKDLRDLIKFALKVNPKDRITIDEMLNHPFIAKANDTFQSRLELTFNNFNTTDNNNEGVNGSIYENRKIVQYKAEVCGKNFCFASAKRTLSWNGF